MPERRASPGGADPRPWTSEPAGVRSLVFDYAQADRDAEVLAAARWLRAHGVVSLSGERILGAQPDLLATPAACGCRPCG